MYACPGFLQAADARAYRERAEQRIRSLEAALEDQAKDRAAAVVVIEQLQKELREARCECVVLTDQRRYFEERAAAAGVPPGCPGQTGPVRGDPDAGPGLVPVQELIEARAQAADARAGAFAAQQEMQTAEEHAVEFVRQLRERVQRCQLTAWGSRAGPVEHGAVLDRWRGWLSPGRGRFPWSDWLTPIDARPAERGVVGADAVAGGFARR